MIVYIIGKDGIVGFMDSTLPIPKDVDERDELRKQIPIIAKPTFKQVVARQKVQNRLKWLTNPIVLDL